MKWDDANSKNVLTLMVLFFLILSIQACSTGHKHRRGRLSDAMEKASDKHQGSRRVEAPKNRDDDYDGPPSYPPHHEGWAEAEKKPPVPIVLPIPESTEPREDPASESTEPRMSEKAKGKKPVNPFGLSGGIGLLKSDDFSELIDFDLSIGLAQKQSKLEFYIGGGWAGVDRASELDSSIDDGVILTRLGVNYKYKLSEAPKWNTPYFLVGGAYNQMYWSYENNIITADGETIGSDSLQGLEFYAGFGKKLIKIGDHSFGVEVFPAMILWHPDTAEGFQNDVFDPFFMLKIRAVFSSW